MTRDNVDLDLDTMLIIESSYLLQYFFFLIIYVPSSLYITQYFSVSNVG